jgi:hypothetical protein
LNNREPTICNPSWERGRSMGKKLRWGEGGVEVVMWRREKVGKKWEQGGGRRGCGERGADMR